MGASSYGPRLTSPRGGHAAHPWAAPDPEPERCTGPLAGVVHPDARPPLDLSGADRWGVQDPQLRGDEVRTVLGPGDVHRPAQARRPVEPDRPVEPIHWLEPPDEH